MYFATCNTKELYSITEKIAAIKAFRERTGTGLLEAKIAIEAAFDGTYFHLSKALANTQARVSNLPFAANPVGLEHGFIATYNHNNRVGAIVEIRCETDFTARSTDFVQFCNQIAQQVVGINPVDLSQLLESPWLRNASSTIGDLLKELSHKYGEKIFITKFSRYEVK